jgi:hypothetical protein
MAEQAVEIPKHYVPTFERNILYALQQKASLLEAHVTGGSAQGEGAAPVDVFGDTEAEEANDRNGDSPNQTVTRERRWMTPTKWDWGTLLDSMDQLKQVLDPTSILVESAKMALGRKLDRAVIMPAFYGAVRVGKDMTDAFANSTVTFDTSKYRIANTFGSSGGATPVGMNVAKLMANFVDVNSERPKVAITAQQWSDLFNDAKAVNGDYINGRPMMEGDLPLLLGFDFVQVEQLPSAGTSPDDRYNPVWVKSGIQMRKWQDIKVQIGIDPGKKFRPRVYVSMAAGAVRAQEGKVLQVVCREP